MKFLVAALLALSMMEMTARAEPSLLRNVHTIVFLGDSLTDGAEWPDWVISTLQTDIQMRGIRFYNAGVGGDKVGGMKARLQTDVLSLHPDLVVMHAGTNDVFGGTDKADYERDLNDIVQTLKARKVKVVLLTPPAVKSAEACARLSELNAIIRSVAARNGCLVGDARAAFDQAIAAGAQPIGEDGVHHTAEGWRLMATTVLKTLQCSQPLVQKVHRLPGILTGWYIGPAIPTAATPKPVDELAPSFDAAKAGWRKYDAESERKTCVWWRKGSFDRGAVYPFGDPKRQDHAAAYAWTRVVSPKQRQTLLRVGGNNPYTVWLNGVKVWEATKWHGWHADTDRILVKLRQGANHILVYSDSVFYVGVD